MGNVDDTTARGRLRVASIGMTLCPSRRACAAIQRAPKSLPPRRGPCLVLSQALAARTHLCVSPLFVSPAQCSVTGLRSRVRSGHADEVARIIMFVSMAWPHAYVQRPRPIRTLPALTHIMRHYFTHMRTSRLVRSVPGRRSRSTTARRTPSRSRRGGDPRAGRARTGARRPRPRAARLRRASPHCRL